MRVYHFLLAADALADLEKKRLKISQLNDLNDPFELLAVELPDRKMRKIFSELKQKIAREHGVVCFSKKWSNPVLWSHYADKHRGICLGFDVPDEPILHIAYDSGRLLLDIRHRASAGSLDRAFMLKLLSTKYKDWKYEDEVRIFADLKEQDPNTGMYFKEFDENLKLREIILGARCKSTSKEIDVNIREYTEKVILIHSRLAFRSFRIVENKAKKTGKG